MDSNQKIPRPTIPKSRSLSDKVNIESTKTENVLISFNFSKFRFEPISIQGFNNHFKDRNHVYAVAVNLIGKTLPIISRHKYSELCDGHNDLQGLHFHEISEDERTMVQEILRTYGFSQTYIEQINEGNGLIQFSGTMGHVYPIRIVCHKSGNTLYLLFVDTNHHIYMNEKYVKETLFFEKCPEYIEGTCQTMKYLDECFAFSYLDTEKIRETYGFATEP